MFSEAYHKTEAGIWTRDEGSTFLYSDGDEVENRLLQQLRVAKDVSLASDELQRLMVDWPSEYHFSPLRANLLSPFDLGQFGTILEVGSGCGAITRQLGENCADSHIIALEGSARRALITRERCRDLDNVEVCVESFADFESETAFDLITLIGVLEYSPSFFSAADPVKDTLTKAFNLLSPNGVLIVAIENQLGLKYFNGCAEDHNGRAFFGINDQYLDSPVRTFGKKQLRLQLASSGFEAAHFFYPFPDYKLPQLMVREEAVSHNNLDIAYLIGQYPARDYSRSGDKLFRESRAWKLLSDNGLVPDLSNSFLVFAGKDGRELNDFASDWLIQTFCGQRKKHYLVRNEFHAEGGTIQVRKKLSYPTSAGNLSSDPIMLHHIGEETYQQGIPFGYLLLDRVSEENPFNSFVEYLAPWVKWLEARSFWSSESGTNRLILLPGRLYDAIPTNFIMGSDEQLVAIDQEWELSGDLEIGFILYRGVLGSISANLDYLEEIGMFEKESVQDILLRVFQYFELPYDDEIYRRYCDLEVELQYEIIPFHKNKDEFVSNQESFLNQERTKKSTLSELVTAGVSVEYYNFLSRQYEYWLEEGKALLGEIRKLDKDLQGQNKKLGESEQEIHELVEKVQQRNAMIANIRSSFSWQLTVPLRLASYIIRGDWDKASASVKEIKHILYRRLQGFSNYLLRLVKKTKSTESKQNRNALNELVEKRYQSTSTRLLSDGRSAFIPNRWPAIDISAVTYNSAQWIDGFVDSLIAVRYPKELLSVHFVDNSSTDETVERISSAIPRLERAGYSVFLHKQKNAGFGAGHNTSLRAGSSPFFLVTNVDLTFDNLSLENVAATAVGDDENVAAWELRQRPYEHPKFYDPVTGITNWNSHACILFKRSSLESAGGYDETLFMYGEDVELSYRLRRSGALLRYCPAAAVDHFSYAHAGEIKPIQYRGSTFANLYIRLKFGTGDDILAIPFMIAQLLLAPSPFPKARLMTLKNIAKLAAVAPKALWSRKKPSSANIFFPFRTWDYDLVREGAFVKQSSLPKDLPLVSIITRTYQGRELYLWQAMLSVAQQSYPNIQHIVVEDGGHSLQKVVDEIGTFTGTSVVYREIDKRGRSVAGNIGLERAEGKYCLFLDDDDLLFGDHVELLVGALYDDQEAVAAYSFAWEIVTDIRHISKGMYRELSHQVPQVLQEDYNYDALRHHNLWAIQSLLFERKLFEKRGGFDEDLEVLEDWVLWGCYGYGNKILRVPKVTSLFRTPSDQKVRDERQTLIDAGYEMALVRTRQRIAKLKEVSSTDVNAVESGLPVG